MPDPACRWLRAAPFVAIYKLDQAQLKPDEAPKASWFNNAPATETQGEEKGKTNGEPQFERAFEPDFAAAFERVFEPGSVGKVETHVNEIE